LNAILPAAGLGTRMAEVTGGRPKEMLSLGGIPVLQWVIDECRQAGCETIGVVGSPHKPQIAGYLAEFGGADLPYFEQFEPRGLADAVRTANFPIAASLVPMPDTVFLEHAPSPALAAKIQAGAWAAVAVREIPLDQVGKYGIVAFDPSGQIVSIVEKPTPEEALSCFAIAGRFALSEQAMALLQSKDPLPENWTLTDLLAECLATGERLEVVLVDPDAPLFDCGSPEGYFAAVEALAR